jgi:hypothetical protein
MGKPISKSRRPSALVATAYHEAGHAVADWKLGFEITRVTIVPSIDHNGEKAYGYVLTRRLGLKLIKAIEDGRLTEREMGYIHGNIVAMFAGIEAQRKWNPRSVRSYHGEGDRENIVNFLVRLHSDNNREASYAFKYLRARARNFVEHGEHWRIIEDLARELLERKTMNGKEVFATIVASMDAPFGKCELSKLKPEL